MKAGPPVQFEVVDVRTITVFVSLTGSGMLATARTVHIAYDSDMTDAEREAAWDAMPVPLWLEGRGGQPEGYCRRQLLNAVRYPATPPTPSRSSTDFAR